MLETRAVISSRFTITGEKFDPEQFTKDICVEPTEIGLTGQERSGGRPKVQKSHWTLTAKERRCDNIDEVLSELLDVIWPVREKLLRLISVEGVEAGFESTVKVFVERPEYCLEAKTLSRLAYFGVSFCLGIYDYSEDRA